MGKKKKQKVQSVDAPWPAAFLERMREDLGEGFDAFEGTLSEEPVRGIRLNPLKRGTEGSACELTIFAEGAKKVPWAACGYYLEEQESGEEKKLPAGKHPLQDAGCYYIQEPSAMAPAQLLWDKLMGLICGPGTDLRDGQSDEELLIPDVRILDLCAAPGGKSTQLAALMKGQGLLVSNEIHPARAKILSENLERMAVRNALVTNEGPEKLSARFPGFFDGILVDAPCSGEGMFRKDAGARTEWSPENVAMCAERQEMILEEAAKMLRPGGVLVYSTCTFAPAEDEEQIRHFTQTHPEFTVTLQKKLLPSEIRGEGHFEALLFHNGDGGGSFPCARPDELSKDRAALLEEFAKSCLSEEGIRVLSDPEQRKLFGDSLWLMPKAAPRMEGLKVLRCGLQIGSFRKERFEPAHALALALSPKEVLRAAELSTDEALRYLHGESLPLPDAEAGWTLVCTEGFSLGWGKVTGGILKNHYPKGLRSMGYEN